MLPFLSLSPSWQSLGDRSRPFHPQNTQRWSHFQLQYCAEGLAVFEDLQGARDHASCERSQDNHISCWALQGMNRPLALNTNGVSALQFNCLDRRMKAPLTRIFHESLATTTDMDVLPGVLECRPLRRTVQVRLGTNTLRLPGGTPIFVVSRQQFMKYPG